MTATVEEDKKAIQQVIQSFGKHLDSGDMAALKLLWHQNERSALLTSVSYVVYTGWQNILDRFEQIGDEQIPADPERKYIIKHLDIIDNFAWVVIDGSITFTSEMHNQRWRISGIFQKFNNEWKILHWHASVSDISIAEDQVFPKPKNIMATIEKWVTDFELNPYIDKNLKQSHLINYLQKAMEIIQQTD